MEILLVIIASLIIASWPLLGIVAYFHRVYKDKVDGIRTYPFFLIDGFFWDSAYNGYIAFGFEFVF